MTHTTAQKKLEPKATTVQARAEPASVVANLVTPTDTSSNIQVIQRKLGCACGGGCPNWQNASLKIQPKLKIGAPNDKYEQEADRVADQVMSMPEPAAQRQPLEEDEEEIQTKPLAGKITPLIQRQEIPEEGEDEELLQVKTIGDKTSEVTSQIGSDIQSLQGDGQPLSESERSFFEPRFGTDFSSVRVHTDTRAASVARSVNARAFTLGRDVVFGTGQYLPSNKAGRHLMAHELTHVVQQGSPNSAPTNILRKPLKKNEIPEVFHVLISCADGKILFETDAGNYSYALDSCDVPEGVFEAKTRVYNEEGEGYGSKTILDFDFGDQVPEGQVFDFKYQINNQINPANLFKNKSSVTVVSTKMPISSLYKTGKIEPDDPNFIKLTMEQIAARCEANELPNVKTFPFRTTRFGAAPLSARKEGEDIIVRQPVHVFTNKDFRKQTRTLPIETFTTGVKIKKNEVVKVHTYEPKWYKLNITGSTDGDVENEFCVFGENMLAIADASHTATWVNIGITAVEALILFIPVGKLTSQFIIKPTVGASKNLITAGMISLADVAPSALAGIASRTGIVLVEERAVTQAVSIAVGQTVSRPVAIVAERVATKETITKLTSNGFSVLIADAGGKFIAGYGIELAAQGSTSIGATAVSPERLAGFTVPQIDAAKIALGKEFTNSETQVFGDIWTQAANPGESAILTLQNSRRLFNNHRNRFWRAVRTHPEARSMIENMGFTFPNSATAAPVKTLADGRLVRITIDHIAMRQSVPGRALDPSNLRFVFGRENSVVLRLISELDPFQAH